MSDAPVTAPPDSIRWALLVAPSLLLLNWIGVLLGAAALTWRRREGRWPRWRALAHLAGAIALNPRMRVRTLWIATRLLILDAVLLFAFLLSR